MDFFEILHFYPAHDLWRRKKLQKPSSKLQKTSKIQGLLCRKLRWMLKFGASLDLGVCCLDLLFFVLPAAGIADTIHEIDEWQEHGDDDAADHNGQEDDHDRFE
jgi:hypothetical protein